MKAPMNLVDRVNDLEAKNEAMKKAILGAVGFMYHAGDCQIENTDFCTCGMREAKIELGKAAQL
jgi:hypothetical protein